MVNVGDLDREFTLQRPSGDSGYEDVVTGVWGSKRFANGAEALRGGTPNAQVTHVVTMRYREDLRASWRLMEETSPATYLQIAVFGDPDGSLEFLNIYVVELQ